MEHPKKLWLTYAWSDNDDKDIDYIFQELDKTDMEVKYDRRNLVKGQRMWDNIGAQITDPHQCDAWAMAVTPNSLASEACMEELAYALDRALSQRNQKFPIIGLLHNIEPSQLPPALKIRICILLHVNDWVAQTISAVNSQPTGYQCSGLEDFIFKIYNQPETGVNYCIEVQPRLKKIAPFCIALDINERNKMIGRRYGPSGIFPMMTVLKNTREGEDQRYCPSIYWWLSDNEANQNHSYYLLLNEIPRRMFLGNAKEMKWYNEIGVSS